MPSRVERIKIWVRVTQRCDENRAKSHVLMERSRSWRIWRKVLEFGEMGEDEKMKSVRR